MECRDLLPSESTKRNRPSGRDRAPGRCGHQQGTQPPGPRAVILWGRLSRDVENPERWVCAAACWRMHRWCSGWWRGGNRASTHQLAAGPGCRLPPEPRRICARSPPLRAHPGHQGERAGARPPGHRRLHVGSGSLASGASSRTPVISSARRLLLNTIDRGHLPEKNWRRGELRRRAEERSAAGR